MRVGIGYDVHRFGGKRPLKLGGVAVAHPRGLSGHSDADVVLHALADALFGAIGAPDLGEQFSPRNRRFRNADSQLFVHQAKKQVAQGGWVVGNVDTTVIADAPNLTRYKSRMRRAISRSLGIDHSQVSVKAKTTEGFGHGRDGIAAQAIVILLPSPRPVNDACQSGRRWQMNSSRSDRQADLHTSGWGNPSRGKGLRRAAASSRYRSAAINRPRRIRRGVRRA